MYTYLSVCTFLTCFLFNIFTNMQYLHFFRYTHYKALKNWYKFLPKPSLSALFPKILNIILYNQYIKLTTYHAYRCIEVVTQVHHSQTCMKLRFHLHVFLLHIYVCIHVFVCIFLNYHFVSMDLTPYVFLCIYVYSMAVVFFYKIMRVNMHVLIGMSCLVVTINTH